MTGTLSGGEFRPPGLGVGRVRDFESTQPLSAPPEEITIPGFHPERAAPPQHEEPEEVGQQSLFPEGHLRDPWHVDFKGVGSPPKNYYKQSSNSQEVLPGLEMSPEEHAEAAGMKFRHLTGAHRLDHPDGSYLEWRDTDYHPSLAGEILMIRSNTPGMASKMHATARNIASENPDEVSFPRHSKSRTLQGKQWVPKEQRKYGEEEW